MGERILIEGNAAVAYALKQINPDVVAAYPITPATEVVQVFSEYVANGEVDTEFVAVESEHSAMSACIGASVAGGRVMTATSAQGLALMWEMLYIASALRCPIVMTVANRALSANINIHCDHSDSMGARDSGWVQLYSENTQEIYDNMIQGIRIAEHEDVRIPVMVCYDGFVLSHALEVIETNTDEQVQQFIGEFHREDSLLDVDNPKTFGPLDLQDFYFEHKRQQAEVYEHIQPVVEQVGKEYGELSGRSYGPYELYRMDDAEVALVALGSTAGTIKDVVDELREQGRKVGLVKLRMFRPFPAADLVDILGGLKAVGVMDRSTSLGGFGAQLWTEIRSALYGKSEVPVLDYIYGLGGREIQLAEIVNIFDDVERAARDGKVEDAQLIKYVGVRE